MTMTSHPEHRRDLGALCTLYFLAFTSAYVWTLFPRTLESLGWTGAAIGTLYSARKVVDASSLWGWGVLADRWNRRAIVRIQLAIGSLATILVAAFTSHDVLMVAAVLCFSATAACMFPVADSLTIARVGARKFGFVRSWGSAGYALMALGAAGLGLWFGEYEELAAWTPGLLAITMLAAVASTLFLPDADGDATRRSKPSLEEFLACIKHPSLLMLLLIGALHWSCQAPLNLFLVALCEHKELPVWAPGLAIFIAVTCEFVVLANSEWLLKRMPPVVWLLIAIGCGAVRWWMMSVADDVFWMMASQALHGLTFGAFFMSSIAMLTRRIPDGLRSSGQALFYLSVFGLGAILGNSASGYIFDAVSVVLTYQVAAVMELALLLPAGLFAWYVIKR